VPSLREWLTRKQKETRRGRAELLLADRAAVWNNRPENRQLPSLLQWVQIKWHTGKKSWTPAQRKMMGRASRVHLVRGLLAAAALVLLVLAGWEAFGRIQAHHLRDRLMDAKTSDVPEIVAEMGPYRRWLDPLLYEEYGQAAQDNDRRKLHASLGLVPVDPGQVDYLKKRLLEAEAQEVDAIRTLLLPHQGDLTAPLWQILSDPKADLDQRFRAGCALARYTPEHRGWEKVRGAVAGRLVNQPVFNLGAWADNLKGVSNHLLVPLASFLQDEKRSGSERATIAGLYKILAQGQPDALPRLERILAEEPNADALLDKKVTLWKRQANVAAALVGMGRPEKVWPLLEHSPDPTRRSFLIDRLAPGGAQPKHLLRQFNKKETNITIKRALLLALGEYGLDRLPEVERQNALPDLLEVYRSDPDPGLHGAADWLLRQWKEDAKLKAIDKEFKPGKAVGDRRWYLTTQGQTMVVVEKPGLFPIPEDPVLNQKGYQCKIDRSFAIAARDVTLAEFQVFRKGHMNLDQESTGDRPVDPVSWHDAAAYCNWLSKKEDIPEDQWCYELDESAQRVLKMKEDYLGRTGYRLPTEAEWEYACRFGAVTGYSFGEAEELLGKYGWFVGNALGKSHPVGEKRPNDLGLFDMHGNLWRWCQDRFSAAPQARKEKKFVVDEEDKADRVRVNSSEHRVLRGGAWHVTAVYCRAAYRNRCAPGFRYNGDGLFGFRVARSVAPRTR
jgi:formylglycine-generating enzyme required for sulfatase activity